MGQLKFTIAYASFHRFFVVENCGGRREKAGLFVSLKIFGGGSEEKRNIYTSKKKFWWCQTETCEEQHSCSHVVQRVTFRQRSSWAWTLAEYLCMFEWYTFSVSFYSVVVVTFVFTTLYTQCARSLVLRSDSLKKYNLIPNAICDEW